MELGFEGEGEGGDKGVELGEGDGLVGCGVDESWFVGV